MAKTLFAVEESAARKMFVEMGFAAYEKCGKPKLVNNLNDLRRVVDLPNAKQPEDANLLDLRDSILAALENKSEIGLRGDTPSAPAKGKPKATKPKATKPKANTPKGEKKLSLVDAAHQILHKAKEPLSVKEIYQKVLDAGLWTPKAGTTPEVTLGAKLYLEIKKKGSESRFGKAGRGLFAAK
jgi:HB1, ASXL, restriction endonuclease HTH domain